jgi:hypothetical protein
MGIRGAHDGLGGLAEIAFGPIRHALDVALDLAANDSLDLVDYVAHGDLFQNKNPKSVRFPASASRIATEPVIMATSRPRSRSMV